MKYVRTATLRPLLFCLMASFMHLMQAQIPFGSAKLLSEDWRFSLNDDSTAAEPSFNDRQWTKVSIPHDWSATLPMSPDAGSCQGFLHGGVGWYRCHFDTQISERTYIYFEGIYNRATVYVNGHLLGYRPSGYAPQIYELTNFLNKPEGTGDNSWSRHNIISVRVNHAQENDSRWYTGSGINRPVWLIKAAAAHFAPWGVKWEIKRLQKNKATVEVNLKLCENFPDGSDFITDIEVMDADGNVVARKSGKLSHMLTIDKPRTWSLESPYLYKVKATLHANGKLADTCEVPLGLRTFSFSPDKGFSLNGKATKIKGVCIHDDAGVLGTAVPTEVWRERLYTLKQLGVNAIRMSHNPHASVVYSLCDSLGLLVMDEASDEWELPKRKWLKGWNKGQPGFQGTFDFFEEWIERDVADMVRRNRMHPSIFLWSIGNEVDYPNDPYSHPILDGGAEGFTQPMYGGYKPKQPNAERIGIIAQRLAAVVRSLDNTRAVTGALAGVVMSNQTAYPEAVDVVGYNYTESRYAEDHKRYPKRVIYGSENRHDLPAWKAVRDNDFIFGQFLWTGIDYLGESGPWPARGSEAGLIDLAGYVKPLGHYRAALWSEQPVCYIGTYPAANPNGRRYRGREVREWISQYALPSWNYSDGQKVRVVCYTNAHTARLLLNGKEVGGEPKNDPDTDILYWDIDYHNGTLVCEADNGAKYSVCTTGMPSAITASVCAQQASLSGSVGSWKKTDNTAIVDIEIVDSNGLRTPLADNIISCRLSGPWQLLGLENGDIRDTSDKTAANRRAFRGRLRAYLKRTAGKGPGTATFYSPLLRPTTLSLGD